MHDISIGTNLKCNNKHRKITQYMFWDVPYNFKLFLEQCCNDDDKVLLPDNYIEVDLLSKGGNSRPV